MKRTLITLVFIALTITNVLADDIQYDFSAVCESGQTLYYKITSGNNVMVTYPISYMENHQMELYNGYPKPTGNLIIPQTVINNNVTYSVNYIGTLAFYHCKDLTSVVIPNSVTSIGSSAFHGCSGLTSITIPNSITSIQERTFSGCTGLTSVTIPNSVTRIGQGAFECCSGLTSVTIPNSVTNIDYVAFYGCSSLTSVTIPNSVTNIDNSAFGYCSNLIDINVENGNTEYTSIDGVLFNYSKTTLACCPAGKTDSYTIPNSVTSIGNYAFYTCSKLKSVSIPKSVTSIGDNAFEKCNGLKTFAIGNGVTSIGTSAFYGCSSLTTVTIPESVTSIWGEAFRDCINLKTVYFNAKNFKSMGVGVFPNNYSLTIIIGDNVKAIPHSTFIECDGVKAILIPATVTSIGSQILYRCNNLAAIYCEATAKPSGWESDWNGSSCTNIIWGVGGRIVDDFVYTVTSNSPRTVSLVGYIGNGEDITIPSKVTLGVSDYSVTSIGKDAFKNRATLIKSISIPETITSIGEYAFSGCTGLTSVTIPNSVTSIGDYAFSGCNSLKTIAIPNSVTSISVGTFSNCKNLISITFPNTINIIYNGAFSGCSRLQFLDIPSSVTILYGNIVDNCTNLQYISMHRPTPPTTIESTFSSLDVTFPFYIPCGSLSNYNSSNKWKDKNLIEDFVYRLDLEPNDVERGNAEIVTAPTCGGAAVIKAVSNRYFEFTHWSDGNTDNPRSILITQDTKLTANFQYRLVATVVSADESMGTVSESSGVFNDITDIEISATPEFGYHFTQWSDGVTANPRVVRLATDTLLQAQFAANPQTITLTSNDETRGTVEGGGVSRYNTLNTVRATATGIYRFGKWSDGNMENPRQILLTSDTALMAIFVEDRLYNVDVTSQDSAKGTVSGTGKYDYGTEVVLQATPAKNCFFVRWNDGETSNPRLLVVEKDFNYQAVFDTLQIFNVRVLASNASLGTVSGSGQFVSGSQATLSATAAEHYVFSQWSDGRTDNPRNVRVIADATYTAVFEPMEYYVKLAQNNANMGMVSGDGVYSYGTVVSCLATPYPNYHFVQWSNGERANPYEFVVSEDVPLLTAYFAEGVATAIGDENATAVHVYAHGRTIVVENADAETFVYDAMGKLICRDAINRVRAELQVNTAGVYIVKVGNVAKRVVVE